MIDDIAEEFRFKISNANCKSIAQTMMNMGYVEIAAETYISPSPEELQNLIAAQLDFYGLSSDPHGGGRRRAYSQYQVAPDTCDIESCVTSGYVQSAEYNYDDGGIVRHFPALSSGFVDNPLIQSLLRKDLQIAQSTTLVDWAKVVKIGLHQVRYYASPEAPSYSSPIWLHRDDEPIVFVHLFNLSSTSVGGDNLISSGTKKIDRVIRLLEPMQTLGLSQKVLHAVTPVGSKTESGAFRDILLVTFTNEGPEA